MSANLYIVVKYYYSLLMHTYIPTLSLSTEYILQCYKVQDELHKSLPLAQNVHRSRFVNGLPLLMCTIAEVMVSSLFPASFSVVSTWWWHASMATWWKDWKSPIKASMTEEFGALHVPLISTSLWFFAWHLLLQGPPLLEWLLMLPSMLLIPPSVLSRAPSLPDSFCPVSIFWIAEPRVFLFGIMMGIYMVSVC